MNTRTSKRIIRQPEENFKVRKLIRFSDNKYFSSRCLTKAKSVRYARLLQRGFEYFPNIKPVRDQG